MDMRRTRMVSNGVVSSATFQQKKMAVIFAINIIMTITTTIVSASVIVAITFMYYALCAMY